MEYTGIVSEGGKKARSLGFPTVNIPLQSGEASGIYAGSVFVRGEQHVAVIYADQGRKVLEAHILDFDQEVYGEAVSITLHEKIRDKAQFTDDVKLRSAIADDISRVRKYFKR